MADIEIKIENLDKIREAFKTSPYAMSRELNTAIKKTAIALQGETIRNVHPDRGINVITGGLLAATERPPLFSNLKATYEIDISYGIYVHEGTRFMRARPFLKDAARTVNEIANSFFKTAVDKVLSDIGKAS